jgi:hypothetical protein
LVAGYVHGESLPDAGPRAAQSQLRTQKLVFMKVFYLASFIGGLLLAVRIMIVGVERPRDSSPRGERSFRLSPPVLVAFSIVFGAVGYVLTQHESGTTTTRALIAAVLGGATSVMAARLVRRWWQAVPEHDVDDERYVLQGQVARVTKPIRGNVEGEVTFQFGNERRSVRARDLDGGSIMADTEVVIERIENDVAYVESWQEVEKRL